MEPEETTVLNSSELFQSIDGICWAPEWGSHSLHFGLSYEPTASDLFIVTYPRSGTTWMQNIVYNLLNDGQPFDANVDDFFQQNPHLEIDGKQSINMMRRPGAIKTHLPMDRVPYNSLAKYICVIRNPKDVCISYYVFYNMWSDVPKLDFDRFFEFFLEGYLPFGNYFEALRSAWQRSHYSNVLLVSYEEMRTDFQPVIHKIADFINVELTHHLLERVMKHASFDYMKGKFDHERRTFEKKFIDSIEDNAVAAQRQQIFMAESNLQTIRKGEINDWKSIMTPQQSRRIYQRFIDACQGCDGLENYWSKWNVFSTDIETIDK
ncbi:unnamed protein product [Rotaria magnacalcarata]|uniref:Sulfotransferase domain-containing protein n=1 Tax=Rotaria magnacalcarata TaxID=392030 RepID=A0A816ZY49_9BILA|nr:unnamed protein product [Rotaria magnacalcarata]CAF2242745.1 unnamed protein product [Rotaria magnacalcarata]